MFRFKQFTIADDQCGMKVGTDGVLLGAWASVENCKYILDIGTGSGLIALMAAQRASEAEVVGVELDVQAVAQAKANAAASPFASRLRVEYSDVRIFQSERLFDAILCNPPFFNEYTLPPDDSRALARHASLLGFDELIAAVLRLLNDDGSFYVILPYNSANDFVNQCFIYGLKLVRNCIVSTVSYKPPRRVLLAFSRTGNVDNSMEQIVLQNPDGTRSSSYANLTKDFYL